MFKPVQMLPLAQQARQQAQVAAIQNAVLNRIAPPAQFRVVYQYKNFAAVTGWANAAALAQLAADADVVGIGVDAQGKGSLAESVPFINADDVHDLGVTGEGITVAVLDSGIDTDHPDLSDDIAAGAWHFLDGGRNTGPGAEDDHGHGTHVSGIITSTGTISNLGVAPDANIFSYKVLTSGGGFSSLTGNVVPALDGAHGHDRDPHLAADALGEGHLVHAAVQRLGARRVAGRGDVDQITAARLQSAREFHRIGGGHAPPV